MKVSAVVPAKNEAGRIARILRVLKASPLVDEIIVVDGFSKDRTREVATKHGAKVVLQERRISPGKGVAMATGLKHAKGDIILFIDADHKNPTAEWIEKLVNPIMAGKADVVKASFSRPGTDAPVTKLVAKPLLNIFFPETKHVKSPLEGEIAGKRDIFEKVSLAEDWGADVGLVIDCSMNGFRTKSVDLGPKQHKCSFKEDIEELRNMAEQVAKSILRKAYEYGRLSG